MSFSSYTLARKGKRYKKTETIKAHQQERKQLKQIVQEVLPEYCRQAPRLAKSAVRKCVKTDKIGFGQWVSMQTRSLDIKLRHIKKHQNSMPTRYSNSIVEQLAKRADPKNKREMRITSKKKCLNYLLLNCHKNFRKDLESWVLKKFFQDF